jgi:hypothetical protein
MVSLLKPRSYSKEREHASSLRLIDIYYSLIISYCSRRFRASREAAEIQVRKAAFLKAAREQRIFRYDKLASADDWDSNVITPGKQAYPSLA